MRHLLGKYKKFLKLFRCEFFLLFFLGYVCEIFWLLTFFLSVPDYRYFQTSMKYFFVWNIFFRGWSMRNFRLGQVSWSDYHFFHTWQTCRPSESISHYSPHSVKVLIMLITSTLQLKCGLSYFNSSSLSFTLTSPWNHNAI